MPELPEELMDQLVDLVDRLRDETSGFLDTPGDQQLWYNRGYANGMVLALLALGQAGRLGQRRPDEDSLLQSHRVMVWGKAYRHGEKTGHDETHEISGVGK